MKLQVVSFVGPFTLLQLCLYYNVVNVFFCSLSIAIYVLTSCMENYNFSCILVLTQLSVSTNTKSSSDQFQYPSKSCIAQLQGHWKWREGNQARAPPRQELLQMFYQTGLQQLGGKGVQLSNNSLTIVLINILLPDLPNCSTPQS